MPVSIAHRSNEVGMRLVMVADVVWLYQYYKISWEESCWVDLLLKEVGLSEDAPWRQFLLPIGCDLVVWAVN